MTYERRALRALTKQELLEVGRKLELAAAARVTEVSGKDGRATVSAEVK